MTGNTIESIQQLLQNYAELRVVSSSLNLDCHLSIQTEFMKSRLIDMTPAGRNKTYGILTDSTYSFFRKGYLLSSCVYCSVLFRWVPILFTWILNIDESSQIRHFVVLIEQILDAVPDENEQDQLIAQVVDFSASQLKAFKNAYIMVRRKMAPMSSTDWTERVETLIRGCQ